MVSARRVLVVDDNLDAAQAFAVMVERFGHKAEFALNGYAALKLAREFRPEIVFVDLVMPGLDGVELIRRLKKEFGDAVRIIAVTAYGTDKDRERTTKAGCELHLLKPVEPRLIETLLV
jgi:CheY-like chemotaxis protein